MPTLTEPQPLKVTADSTDDELLTLSRLIALQTGSCHRRLYVALAAERNSLRSKWGLLVGGWDRRGDQR